MKKLDVHLTNGPGDRRLVGQLVETGRSISFEYDSGLASVRPIESAIRSCLKRI